MATELPGTWQRDQTETITGPRNFYFYIPKISDPSKPIPLMVMLHGCFQDASELALDSGMNEVAQQFGFAVLYPEQTLKDNAWKCWNWFDPKNQTRGEGELQSVVDLVNFFGSKHLLLKKDAIFVAGISAGGSMAANLVACYSDIFAGVAIHSGLEFRAATSEAQAHEAMSKGSSQDLKESALVATRCTGAAGKRLSVIAIHGGKDEVVNPLNSARLIEQFANINDLLDDGRANDSENAKLSGSTLGAERGLSYQMEFYGNSKNLARLFVPDLEHKWCGAARTGAYAEPRGPAAALVIWNFFQDNLDLSRMSPAKHTEK